MTSEETGRVLAVYYGTVSALELLNNYCDRLLLEDKKEFHSREEKYHYNNMKTAINRAKYCFEQYQKLVYTFECEITDDNGTKIKDPNEFQRTDENIKIGICYVRFLFFLYNLMANADKLKDTFIKLESTFKLFIKKWFIPEEAFNQFQIRYD